MEEKFKKFQEVDWSANEKWQNYFSNLYPTPPGNKVEYFKRKFYKMNIDEDFDINYTPNNNSNTSNNNFSNQSRNNPYAHSTGGVNINQSDSKIFKGFTLIENILWVFSIFYCFTYLPYIRVICIIPYIIRIIRRVGRPNLTYNYAEKVMLDEHLHFLLYLALLFIDRYNLYLMLPHILTGILNIGEYLKFTNVLPTLHNLIVNNRVLISEIRANLDLFLVVFLIIGIFMQINSIFICIFFMQYLRMKYMLNVDCKYAFSRLNGYVNSKKTILPGPFNFVITKVQQAISYIGGDNRNGENGTNSQYTGPSCTIF